MRKTSNRFPFLSMQQYFVNEPLETGMDYVFDDKQAHHAKTVVRLNNEVVRLVYEGKGYFATARQQGKQFIAHVDKADERVNELSCPLILCMALIRREKMELVLQKATELGVTKIIPFVSSRCVVKEKKEKKEKLAERWNTILLEAAQQCKRNVIPELSSVISFEELKTVDAFYKLCAYENAYGKSEKLTDVVKSHEPIALVIGPEGGFSQEEVQQLEQVGYTSVTFGKRILRAETAAIFGCSVLSEIVEDD